MPGVEWVDLRGCYLGKCSVGAHVIDPGAAHVIGPTVGRVSGVAPIAVEFLAGPVTSRSPRCRLWTSNAKPGSRTWSFKVLGG